MSATTALGALAVLWAGVGLLLARVMGRNGHDPFAWWLLGTLLGPLVLPLAISAQRRRGDRAWLVRSGRPGRGPVDVLVGLDGSTEALPRLAAEGGYDLLVVGSRAAGLSKVLLGSIATTRCRSWSPAGRARRRGEGEGDAADDHQARNGRA